MGSSESKMNNENENHSPRIKRRYYESTSAIYTDDIKCGFQVTSRDILKFMQEKKLEEEDRHLLQDARRFICEEDDFIFKNVEIRVAGRGIDVTFYAGRPKNVYVVYHDDKMESTIRCKSKCFLHHLRDAWKWIVEKVGPLVLGVAVDVAATVASEVATASPAGFATKVAAGVADKALRRAAIKPAMK